ncbi:cytochrome P450, putative [Talaromyces stipitatus ATCC 10500]|uniref:Cytochrome P450, putative n=1 Tax=Talaromyces stipitatus (strain ATCC 10500 / CBS 375.48 / QM 6759 / NRRL 1006) TaxID=441959 RepID=B8MMZ0_TALSN|nr:cytochrome P450, putative [Talaromyces stipitatus ATCC 10500]EED13939.1 cytochrome P450, putative [Talaromyces stipitatus ATCC 10500]
MFTLLLFFHLTGLFFAYSVCLAIYRLYFSPLSKIPGPKLAAITWWYQFHYDVVNKGQYSWVVRSMHEKYGPIVRINPCEVHICESDFYETLYASGGLNRKRDKWTWDTVGAAGVADSALSTMNHDLHRMRRAAIAPFFSMQNVKKLQPIIQAKVDILRRRILERKGNTEAIDISHAFSALTNGTRRLAQIEALKLESSTISVESTHRTIFRELLSSKLPSEEKAPTRLATEAQVLVSAGSETTARALTHACYYLLTSPDVLTTLKTELEGAIPATDFTDSVPLEQVQRLPYLTAVIKESLRLSYGVVDSNASFRMKTCIFTNGLFPRVHRPERWLHNATLHRYLVSFGKGSRQCLGMNLAMSEMHLTLSSLLRWFGSGDVRRAHDLGQLELFETDESDIKMIGEVLVPVVKQDTKGVQIVIKT